MTRAERIEAAALAYLVTFDAADALDMGNEWDERAFDAAADLTNRMDALRAALALPEDA